MGSVMSALHKEVVVMVRSGTTSLSSRFDTWTKLSLLSQFLAKPCSLVFIGWSGNDLYFSARRSILARLFSWSGWIPLSFPIKAIGVHLVAPKMMLSAWLCTLSRACWFNLACDGPGGWNTIHDGTHCALVDGFHYLLICILFCSSKFSNHWRFSEEYLLHIVCDTPRYVASSSLREYLPSWSSLHFNLRTR